MATAKKIQILPTKQSTIVDVPEIEDLRGRFIYNYFERDEKTNNPSLLDSRKITLTWTPNVIWNRRDLVDSIIIGDHYDLVIQEDEFNNHNLKTIDLNQTTGINQDVFQLLETSFTGLSSGSLLDRTKSLYEQTDEELDQQFVGSLVHSQKQSLGVYFDTDSTNIKNEDLIFPVGITPKFMDKIIETIDENNIGFNSFLTLEEREQIVVMASEAKEKRNTNVFSMEDYDHQSDKIFSLRNIKTDSNYQPVFQPVGYVIEKFNKSTSTFEQPLFVEDITISKTEDINVKYDQTYCYRIRTVAYVEFTGLNSETNEYLVFSFLVGSKLSNLLEIECVETTPPPVVTDFDVTWDFVKNLPKISWSFPPNKQRDIKKFQVFRRRTITEPFELIKMYDFDNSTTRTQSQEQPNPEIVELTDNPPLFYWDKKFLKTDTMIYSVCSIDAHGYSSGYSMQLEITWSSNKFKKRLISISGAPKAYPNLFLNQDAFVDSIKTEEFTGLDLYFNPEFIELTDKDSRSLEFLKTGANDTYSLVMINIDNQKQTTFDISLRNRE